MGITLQQIADMAGTTKSTVDKVIHNRPGVSEKKRQEIRRLLEEYDYEANPLAKALNYQKCKLKVAVVLPKISAVPDIKKGIDVVLQDFQSFNIQVEFHEFGSSDAKAQSECIHALLQDNISGALILPIRSDSVAEAIRELIDHRIPVVIVNSELELDGPLCYVGQNMPESGIVAARMLSLFQRDPAQIPPRRVPRSALPGRIRVIFARASACRESSSAAPSFSTISTDTPLSALPAAAVFVRPDCSPFPAASARFPAAAQCVRPCSGAPAPPALPDPA